jgi:hypothetical protein
MAPAMKRGANTFRSCAEAVTRANRRIYRALVEPLPPRQADGDIERRTAGMGAH